VTIQTGSKEEQKRYPLDKWNEVAASLAAAGHVVVGLGAPGDPQITAPGVINQVGAHSLRGAMAAVAASDLHLAVDTGTGHMAAAYGVPVLSLLGNREQNGIPRSLVYGPQGPRCHQMVDNQLTPNFDPSKVTQKALELLEGSCES
jgi:ADP-heptose:LPS heptosyltransferase